MSTELLQKAGNWTAEHLQNATRKVISDAQRAHEGQLALRTRLSQLLRKAREIPEPGARERAVSGVLALTRRLAKQLIDYNSFVTKWRGTSKKVTDWLRSLGVDNTVGALPVVPIAIAGAVAIAAAYVVTMSLTNAAMGRAVDAQERIYNDYMDGHLDWGQYQEASQNTQAALDAAIAAAKKGSPAELVESLMPIALIVLAIVVLPHVIQALPKRRAA